jgi:hypothetical protein
VHKEVHAYARGYEQFVAYLRGGQPVRNPYATGSAMSRHWLEGVQDSQMDAMLDWFKK